MIDRMKALHVHVNMYLDYDVGSDCEETTVVIKFVNKFFIIILYVILM